MSGVSGEGRAQGDPESQGQFCVGVQPEVRALNAALSVVGGGAVFGSDDGYCYGPPEVVFQAMERFEGAARERCGLHLQRSKTEVFSWDGVLPPNTPQGLKKAGITVNGEFQPGFLWAQTPM